MDVDFKNTNWSQEASSHLLAENFCPPDWYGMRSRLLAARAARIELARSGAGADAALRDSAAAGSFDERCARLLAEYNAGFSQGLAGVNPTALSDGNAGGDSGAAVAGVTKTGDRG
jgi:hypothetical protein